MWKHYLSGFAVSTFFGGLFGLTGYFFGDPTYLISRGLMSLCPCGILSGFISHMAAYRLGYPSPKKIADVTIAIYLSILFSLVGYVVFCIVQV